MKTLLVLGGPTASGKTRLAIEWAERENTEILSADSRQCYQELCIGVARPTPDELKRVPHHFIASHSIHQQLTVADYEQYALKVLEELFQRRDTVICCGGTGLYLQALCEGIDAMPAISEAIKKEVEENYKKQGLAWLQEQVQLMDPEFYAQAEQQNPARLLRALTFKLSTTESLLQYQTRKKKTRFFETKCFYIEMERPLLYERINQRVETMFEQGLEEEVRGLWPYRENKNLKTVGYQELFEYFEGKITRSQAKELIKQHTRHYAKRQLTWFRNHAGYEKIFC